MSGDDTFSQKPDTIHSRAHCREESAKENEESEKIAEIVTEIATFSRACAHHDSPAKVNRTHTVP
jgi:hypothetical protein